MEDNQKNGNPETKYDRGTANHLKMKQNDCGCVMEMDVEHDSAGTLSATKARMLTCGIHDTDPSIPDFCSRDHIANPDNVAMIPDYHQLIIGEDTGKHSNNLIWIWDLPTGAMTRVASTPFGAETTSPYWYSIGDWSYMAYIVQHPRSSVTGDAGYIGYVGPFPRKAGMGWHRPDAYWEEMSYPASTQGHYTRTSHLVNLKHDGINNAEVGFQTIYRSGELIGALRCLCWQPSPASSSAAYLDDSRPSAPSVPRKWQGKESPADCCE